MHRQGLGGIRLGPYKSFASPDGEKKLYDLEKDPNGLDDIVRIPDSSRFAATSAANCATLEDCVGRGCREEASEIPLTRKERGS